MCGACLLRDCVEFLRLIHTRCFVLDICRPDMKRYMSAFGSGASHKELQAWISECRHAIYLWKQARVMLGISFTTEEVQISRFY